MSAVQSVCGSRSVHDFQECLRFQSVHDSRSVCGSRVSAVPGVSECPRFQSVCGSRVSTIPGVYAVPECPRFPSS